MLDSAIRDINDKYAKYDKHPEKHPKYPAEWKIFWNRRSDEMIAGKYNLIHLLAGCFFLVAR